MIHVGAWSIWRKGEFMSEITLTVLNLWQILYGASEGKGAKKKAQECATMAFKYLRYQCSSMPMCIHSAVEHQYAKDLANKQPSSLPSVVFSCFRHVQRMFVCVVQPLPSASIHLSHTEYDTSFWQQFIAVSRELGQEYKRVAQI